MNKLLWANFALNTVGEWIKRFCVMFVIIMLSGAWGSSVKEDLLKKDIQQWVGMRVSFRTLTLHPLTHRLH